MARIEFDRDGKILGANENFCDLMGYSLVEIVGKHHSIFVERGHAQSREYQAHWETLRGGKFICTEFKRISKTGTEIYVRGSYNPIVDYKGKVIKIVKFANDITRTILASLDSEAKLQAIERAQASIEFSVDGQILAANRNFLDAVGYEWDEIAGKHHSMFVEESYRSSRDYAAFWEKLNRGAFIADEFCRIDKGGRKVYIQAFYNPVIDHGGKVLKIVKYATDVTERVRAVSEVAQGIRQLSEGDLVQRLDRPFIPALEPLRVDFNTSMDKLQSAMRSVGENANAISYGSDQIMTSANDLARRTEQQAAALEETSSALSEMTEAVKQSSARADEAGQLVAHTKLGAERSGQVVRRTIDAMGEIEKSSDAISKIVAVIDEIAFQTNLLALNAGVEAARAGEAGKGFAVVAQEVRALSQRSADAAKEIKELIARSNSHVGSGVSLVNEAGRALQAMVGEVMEIHEHVQAIVQNARTQSVGLSEINIAIGTLNNATQQNVAMGEESTAASTDLAHEAATLSSLLKTFHTEGTVRSSTSESRDMRRRLRVVG
ncbi:PAS domain-containing methyl-accepting chemotaxis protein [Jiella sp. KSK16Y-1]|uniref:PAS domain-containing methyl-accepting chemotaxis protein n=2 Tax=Jiella mangrovi TaxID=2821407 RepID=A0ABS4BM27_9HYPH|nr:PAS domain-containing methyl-accepting chemotaxis protein [Jiella mangrovi]